MSPDSLPRPIVVLGTPRSGTSLTASIFAAHGVWTGRCMPPGPRNPRGFYENVDVKAALLELCGPLVSRGEVAEDCPRGTWESVIRHAMTVCGDYEGQPWLVKHSALYWRVWLTDFSPIFVCCFRDADQVAASGRETGMLDNPASIGVHHEQMRYLVEHIGAIEVWPEEFIAHRWTRLIQAFTAAGLAFDHETAEACVDPSLWHDWSAAA